MQVYLEKTAAFGVKLRETPVIIVVSPLIALMEDQVGGGCVPRKKMR